MTLGSMERLMPLNLTEPHAMAGERVDVGVSWIWGIENTDAVPYSDVRRCA